MDAVEASMAGVAAPVNGETVAALTVNVVTVSTFAAQADATVASVMDSTCPVKIMSMTGSGILLTGEMRSQGNDKSNLKLFLSQFLYNLKFVSLFLLPF